MNAKHIEAKFAAMGARLKVREIASRWQLGDRKWIDPVVRCIQADGVRAVNRIVEISEAGRAPKNDPAIFALALVAAHGHAEAKKLAFQSLGKVCRIGTHLFHFAEYVNALRGWGRGLRNAVGRWYVSREADDLAHQAVKYQQRDGWPHSDLLRLAHEREASSVAFSPDGHRVITGWWAGVATVWSAATGESLTPPMKFAGDTFTFRAVLGPDGKVVATAGWNAVQLWDTETGKALTPMLEVGNGLSRPCFSREGTWLITPSMSGSAKVWAVPTGFLAASLPHQAAKHAEFSPDGSRVVVAGFNSFRLWETSGWKPAGPEIQFGAIENTTFSPDGRKLLVGGRTAAAICDATNPQLTAAWLKFDGDIACVAFSRDSSLVAIASRDSHVHKGEVCIWEVQTGKPIIQPLREDAGPIHVEFSPDGKAFFTVSTDTASVGEKNVRGGYRIANKGRVRLWRLPTERSASVITALTNRNLFNGAKASPDGSITVIAEKDEARIKDAHSGQTVATLKHKGIVRQIQFTRDGRRFATANDKGIPRGGEVRIWDTRTANPLTPALEHSYGVESVQFSSDGSRLLTACGDIFRNTGEARVWDARTGDPLGSPMQLDGYLKFAGFSPDERFVVTTGFRTARVWDSKTGLPIAPVLFHANDFVKFAEFESDGFHLLTVDGDSNVKRWDVSPDMRPINRLLDLAQALSGQKLDATGTPAHLSREEFQEMWERVRATD